jgi:predicted dehydrogenase
MKMWLVGAGYWGSKVLTSLQNFGVDARVIDIRNGQTINDINDDAPVMLATPLWDHYQQCMTLLERGHDVYVEKPMAETVEQILDLKFRCAPDQIFMVGHIFQHHPQRDEIKTLINTGFIGDLKHISSRRLNWGIYQTRTDPALSLGTHDISIIIDFASADNVVDQSRCYYMTSGIMPDRVVWSGRCGDITYDCDVSWAWPVRTRETVFIGTSGQIVWNQDTNSYTITHNKIIDNRAHLDQQPQVVEYRSELTPLEHEIKHWVDCLSQRQQPSTGIDQALAVAQVIQQINTR